MNKKKFIEVLRQRENHEPTKQEKGGQKMQALLDNRKLVEPSNKRKLYSACLRILTQGELLLAHEEWNAADQETCLKDLQTSVNAAQFLIKLIEAENRKKKEN